MVYQDLDSKNGRFRNTLSHKVSGILKSKSFTSRLVDLSKSGRSSSSSLNGFIRKTGELYQESIRTIAHTRDLSFTDESCPLFSSRNIPENINTVRDEIEVKGDEWLKEIDVAGGGEDEGGEGEVEVEEGDDVEEGVGDEVGGYEVGGDEVWKERGEIGQMGDVADVELIQKEKGFTDEKLLGNDTELVEKKKKKKRKKKSKKQKKKKKIPEEKPGNLEGVNKGEMADKLIEFFKIVDLINQVEKLEATQGTETTELQKVENTLVPQEYGPDEPISITSSLLAEETVSTMYSAESFDKLEVIFPVWSNSSAIQSECTIQLTAQWAQHRVAINELSEKVANEYKRRYREANGNMEVEKEILREGLFV